MHSCLNDPDQPFPTSSVPMTDGTLENGAMPAFAATASGALAPQPWQTSAVETAAAASTHYAKIAAAGDGHVSSCLERVWNYGGRQLKWLGGWSGGRPVLAKTTAMCACAANASLQSGGW